MLITNIDLDMESNFTRVHRGSHGNPDAIEVFEFLLDQVIVLKSAKHSGVVQVKSLFFFYEFGANS